uniref:asparagine synthetase B family protein n=1 Tax=uncultured Erythrobacter sp. TaxID=263913 RepID=UPI00260F9537|nr:asparagine synthase-related protein [uncultured Erythrobacter sp.]
MAGIAAILADGPLDSRLNTMTSVLAANPHDERKSWSQGNTALSACTFATTSEALEAQQPNISEDGQIALVFDGYLTNFEELRRDLAKRGANLRNRSDEELVLRAYEQWGAGCAAKVEGEFAFVIADCRRQMLYCARDHQGLRPLYYYEDASTFIAASSIAAVLAALQEQPSYDHEYLAEVMIGEVYSVDRTGWKGIGRVKPAHFLRREHKKRSETRKYYSLPTVELRSFRRDEEYIEAYREVLSDAVRRTSRTHLHLACEVSGGQDSSAIYSVAHAMAGSGRLLAPSIEAYTLRGETGSEADEIEYARAVTQFTGSNLHEYDLFRPELDWFDAQASAERDMPTYTNAAHSILLEQGIVKNGSRVVLNGMGGDQWLDGSYGYYTQAIRARDLARFIANLRRDVSYYGMRSSLPFALRKLALAALPDSARSALRKRRSDYGALMYEDIQSLSPEYAEHVRAVKRSYLDALPEDEVARSNVPRLDSPQNQRAFDLMYRQRSGLGLEGRSPMFTRQFIEFCNSLPEDMKYRAGRTKWIHREAMRGLMSNQVIERESKASFPERKHDAAIQNACKEEQDGVIAQLIDAERFGEFCALRSGDEIDDSHDWAYWSVYMVISFLRFSAKG